jgi:monofunctional biosynthetic peptidoglycan transglycosylase
VLLLVPAICILALRWIDPPVTSTMLQHNVREALSGGNNYVLYRWRDWEEISKQLAVAVIAAEDQRFPDHFGFDFNQLKKVLESGSSPQRGASTITQQVAKNLFLWHGRSYFRKSLEAGLAVMLEIFWSKQRILEVYLNIAQMGKNIYGASAAAHAHFGKSAGQLNRLESARIAAVLPSPSRYSVMNPSEFVLKRQRWILGQMEQLGGRSLLLQL